MGGYELLDQSLDPAKAFGERIAVDATVVSKIAESTIDLIRDECPAFIKTFPCFHLRGIQASHKKCLEPHVAAKALVYKADAAKEFQHAAEQLGAHYEPTRAVHWP